MVIVAIRNNIRDILKQKDVSILGLAKALGRDYSQVYKLVSKNPLPEGTGIGSLMRIARVLEVPLESLITEIED